MHTLLTLPGEVIRENNASVHAIIELYAQGQIAALEKTVVTKDFNGHPKSYFGDDEWNFSAYLDRRITNKYHIKFDRVLSQKLALEMKLICFAWVYLTGHARKGATIKASTLLARHAKLSVIYQYLDNKGFTSIASLSSYLLFSEYCNHLKLQNYQYKNLVAVFVTLGSVERVSSALPFEFKIPLNDSYFKLAKKLSKDVDTHSCNQFYAIPTRLMERIYRFCFDTINTYHPHREALHELQADLREVYLQGQHAVDGKIDSGLWQWLDRRSPEYRVEVNKHKPCSYRDVIEAHLLDTPLATLLPFDYRLLSGVLIELQTVCYIVCGALTGMRRSELYCLHANSFKEKEIYGKTYQVLESVHHKLTQGRGEISEWVTVPFTKKAIELAEALSRYMRHQLAVDGNPMNIHNSTCLWLSQAHKSMLPLVRAENGFRTHFDRIAKKAGAFITTEDLEEFQLINPNRTSSNADNRIHLGNIWPITTHQFRRTFAVFAKRHSLCSDIAIKQQFKHLDLPTTEWYGAGGLAAKAHALTIDTELKTYLDEVVQESTTQHIYNWYQGDHTDPLMGKMASAIVNNRRELPQTYTSWDAIHEHVRAGRLTLVGTLHSYCLAGYECQMHRVSSPASCMNCEHQLIDKTQAINWQKRHHWVVEHVTTLAKQRTLTASIYSHFITQIRAAEKVMRQFNIPFTHFILEGNEYEQIPDNPS